MRNGLAYYLDVDASDIKKCGYAVNGAAPIASVVRVVQWAGLPRGITLVWFELDCGVLIAPLSIYTGRICEHCQTPHALLSAYSRRVILSMFIMS